MSDFKQPSQTTIPWSDERVEVLKTLWKDGYSASQIAKQLGGITRNAVIGKIHRLGLAGSAGAPAHRTHAALAPPRRGAGGMANVNALKSAKAKAMTAAAPQPTPPVEPPAQTDRHIAASAVVVPMHKLGVHACKWPIGDPLHPAFGFCGARTEATYCSEHAAMAYQAPTTKKKATASELARSLRRYL